MSAFYTGYSAINYKIDDGNLSKVHVPIEKILKNIK